MRLLIRFIMVVVVLAVLAVGALLLVPGDKIANLAAQQFEANTGRKLTIEGDVRTSIYPMLGVRTGPITVANAAWSEGGPMLQADGMSVGVNLISLFSGDIKIKKIEAIAPKILLEVASDGRANWDFGETSSAGAQSGAEAGSIPAFTLDRGIVTAGSVTYVDHKSGERITLTDMDAEIRLPDFHGRADVRLSARTRGQTVGVNAVVQKFAEFLGGGATPLKGEVRVGSSTIDFDGRAGMSPVVAEGALAANLSDMAALFGAMGLEAPELPKGLGQTASVVGNVTYTAEGSVHLRDGVITLDHNVLNGGADLTTKGERPRLKASFTAGALDFSALAPVSGGSSDNATAGGSEWSKEVIDVSGLSAMDAEVGLNATSINLGMAQLGVSKVVVKLDRSRAVFELRDVQAYDGSIKGQFVVNGRGGLSVGGDMKLAGLAMAPLLKDAADYERLIGVGDLQFKFLGVGNSMDAIMNSLSGSGAFKLGKGELLGLDLVGMLRNLDTSYQGEGQKTIFDALGASFTMKDGVLSNDDLAFAAPLARAAGSGVVGIGTQTLKYRVNPVAMSDADGNGGISVPVIISGTWANPKFRPDLRALIDQNLAEEKAALEAKIAAEKAALEARLAAEKAGVEERIAAEKAAAILRLQQKLDLEAAEGETVEEAAKRKAEEEIRRGILDLLGNN